MHSLKRVAVLLCIVMLACLPACSNARTPSPEPPLTPTSAPPAPPHVVILSLSGARDDWVDGYLEDSTMPNLAALAQRGARTEYAQTIDPSLTAAAHISIATGRYPSGTGQVSDKFHLPGKPILWYTGGLGPETDAEQLWRMAMRSSSVTSAVLWPTTHTEMRDRLGDSIPGMDQEVYSLSENLTYWYTNAVEEPGMQAEPLWRTAMRNGLTTATLFWPGTHTDIRDQRANYTVAYGSREVFSAVHVITPTQASPWQDAPSSYSPLLEATLRITARDGALVTTLYLLAADSTDDQQENYDLFFLSRDKRVDAGVATLRVGEWAPLLARPQFHGGGYFKLLSATSERIEVYQSALWYNRAHPAELLREINDNFGFFPPSPDYYALEQGWITAQDYWEMAERQTRWMAEVITYVFTMYQPDLSFVWLGVTDECGHQFLMADERQLDYSDETAQAYAEYVRNAYAMVDECLGNLLNILLLGRDTIFVLSDHGMAPIHSQVYVNTILEQAGLLRYGEGSNFPVDTAHSKAVAFASGGAVNVYINLQGREQPGIVPPEDYASVQDEIVDALQSAVNADGEALFARVLRREELPALHLDSPNSGDVFAQAALGYALTDRRGNPEVVEPAPYYGQHGYDSTWPEMHAILVAAGYGIRPGVRLPAVHLLDVLPTAASLLRVKPVEPVDGRALVEMLQERP